MSREQDYPPNFPFSYSQFYPEESANPENARWNPLCQFLEVDEPKEEFPNLNDRKDLVSVHVFLRNLAIQRSVVNMGKILAPLLAVGLSWWVYQARLP